MTSLTYFTCCSLFVLYFIWRYCLHFWLEEEQTCFVGILWFVSVFVLCHYFPFELSSFLVKQNIVLRHCSIEVLNLHNILILQKKDSVHVSGYHSERNIYSEITLAMKTQFKVISIVSQCPVRYQSTLDMVVVRKFWWLWVKCFQWSVTFILKRFFTPRDKSCSIEMPVAKLWFIVFLWQWD